MSEHYARRIRRLAAIVHDTTWDGCGEQAPSAALKKALLEPDVAHALTSQGSQIVITTPQQFANFVADEVVKWKRLAEAAGVEPS
jgi:hypothetical protein